MNDYIHKLMLWLVEQYDEIYVEDLNVKEIVEDSKSKTLRKHILQSNFSTFMIHLSYKASSASRRVVKVDPRNTSKTCAKCGHVKNDLTLADCVFSCPKCGCTVDSDYNASLNILRVGSGLPLEPVYREPLYTFPSQKGCIVGFLEEAGILTARWGCPVCEDGVVHLKNPNKLL